MPHLSIQMGKLGGFIRFKLARDRRKKENTSSLFGMMHASYIKSSSFPMTFLQAGREIPTIEQRETKTTCQHPHHPQTACMHQHSLVNFPSSAPIDDLGLETLLLGFRLDPAFELVTFSDEADVLPVIAMRSEGLFLSASGFMRHAGRQKER